MKVRLRQHVARSLVVLATLGLGLGSAYAGTPQTPTVAAQYNGGYNPASAPASATIAANANEQIQLVNSEYVIITKQGITKSGSLASLIGTNGTFLSDQQIIWDPASNRFYFSIFENRGTSTPDEGIAWGFSKIANPKKPTDFCTYFNGFDYGASSFPDRQSLGDTSDFLLIGSNRYSTATGYAMGSDLAWITKPASGKTCPSASSFGSGITSLQNPDGTPAYTPTPAKQVDTGSTGSILATPSYLGGSSLSLFSVTKSGLGAAIVSPASSVTVPAYANPPYAPQAGTDLTGQPARPLETRIYLTQVTSAYDARLKHMALWTAQTIAGGAGSEVRWYEINPTSSSTDQIGTISDPSLSIFNATIAPDRVVKGKKAAFGDSAVINVSTSSSTTFPAIQMASTISGQPTSPLVMVKQSTGANIDYTCFQPSSISCRWGDYSGATPDPASPLTGSHGLIWLTNQWNTPDLNDNAPVWQTIIWKAAI